MAFDRYLGITFSLTIRRNHSSNVESRVSDCAPSNSVTLVSCVTSPNNYPLRIASAHRQIVAQRAPMRSMIIL